MCAVGWCVEPGGVLFMVLFSICFYGIYFLLCYFYFLIITIFIVLFFMFYFYVHAYRARRG